MTQSHANGTTMGRFPRLTPVRLGHQVPVLYGGFSNGTGGETVVRRVRRLGNGGEVSDILWAGFSGCEAADPSVVLNIADSSGTLVV